MGKFLKKLYNLLIINTLDDLRNIKSLYSGTVAAVFGTLFCLAGYFLFTYLALEHSTIISLLGLYAYMTIIVHHVLEIERTKWPDIAHWIPAPVIFVLMLVFFTLLLFVLDTALALSAFMNTSHATLGFSQTILKSLPGLLVLTIPLFCWESLCKYTPIDELVKRYMK